MIQLLYSLAAALFFALTFFLRKRASQTLSPTTALLIEAVVETIIFAVIVFFLIPHPAKDLAKSKGITYAALAGLTIAIGVAANFLAVKSGSLTKVVAITSPSQIIFGVLLGMILLKETITTKTAIGIFLSVAGIVIVSI